MERLERRPKSGNGDKVYVTFRATGWRGVENALLTSAIQATPYKEQNNLFRGQLKVLTDHTGAYFASPIAVNGPQGETRAEALQKLEGHYAILAAWVSTEFGDGDEEVEGVPPKFVSNYKAAFGRVESNDVPVKRRKLNVAAVIEEPPVLSISEQAMQLALKALALSRARPTMPLMAPAVPMPPTSPAVESVQFIWTSPPILPKPAAPAPVVAAAAEFATADNLTELDARIASRRQMLYDPLDAGEASLLSQSQACELYDLLF